MFSKNSSEIFKWAFLSIAALFLVLSVAAAFLGAERAESFFTSPVMVVLWAVFILASALGAALLKSSGAHPGVIVMHVGLYLVLSGAVVGSERARFLSDRFREAGGIHSGYMLLRKGEPESLVMDDDVITPAGELPFSLRLEEFRVEYYEPEDENWRLWVEVYEICEREGRQRLRFLLNPDWEKNKEFSVPGTGIIIKAVEYIQRARPVYERAPELWFVCGSSESFSIPAEAGSEIELESPRARVRINDILENSAATSPGGSRMEIEVERGGAAAGIFHIAPGYDYAGIVEGLKLRYVVPGPSGAKRDGDSERPAMRIAYIRGGESEEKWLIPPSNRPYALNVSEHQAGDEAGEGLIRLNTYLVEPERRARSYKSKVAVEENGEEVKRKVIRVNEPLYYGGYHFYQDSYDTESGLFTVLYVRSSAGLKIVYAGFIVLCAGAFLWGRAGFIKQNKGAGRRARRGA